MTTIHKPNRKKIKQAIRHLSRLTNLPMVVYRNFFKTPQGLRKLDSLLKANTMYPTDVSDLSQDPGQPIEMKVQFYYGGKKVNPPPLVEQPEPIKPLTPQRAAELLASMRAMYSKAPQGFQASFADENPDPSFSWPIIITTPMHRRTGQASSSLFESMWRNAIEPAFVFQLPSVSEQEVEQPLVLRINKQRPEVDPSIYHFDPHPTLKDMSDDQPGTTDPLPEPD